MAAPRSSGARYPLHELEVLLGWPTAAQLAAELGVSKMVVAQWRVRGLSHPQADRVACHFNLHPVLLWPEWVDALTYDVVDPKDLWPPRVSKPLYGVAMPNRLEDVSA
ncbi:hypothetical protein BH23ACT2_BH23ACT2_24290 [soil metagenome]